LPDNAFKPKLHRYAVHMAGSLGVMSKFIAFVVFVMLSFAFSACAAQDAFDEARELARAIILAELDGPLCNPAPIPTSQRTKMTQLLSRIDRPGLVDRTGLGPLDLAVISNDIPTIRRIIALGYPLDTPGSTLLHGAVLHHSMRALSYLLANGANPNSDNSHGATPLMSAAADGRMEAARSLLAAGADPDARNNDNGTALHYAIGCRNQEMANLLVEGGASIDAKARALADKYGLDILE
jgi:ankyrin repeat protein